MNETLRQLKKGGANAKEQGQEESKTVATKTPKGSNKKAVAKADAEEDYLQ